MFLTCIMQCMPTSTEIMLLFRGSPSNFLDAIRIWHLFFSLRCGMCRLIIVIIRFFKESSIEEREHSEKLMEYQVICATLFYRLLFNTMIRPVWSVFFYISFVLLMCRIREVDKSSCSLWWCPYLTMIISRKGMHCMVGYLPNGCVIIINIPVDPEILIDVFMFISIDWASVQSRAEKWFRSCPT